MIAEYLHEKMCKHYHYQVADKSCEHKPNKIAEDDIGTIETHR